MEAVKEFRDVPTIREGLPHGLMCESQCDAVKSAKGSTALESTAHLLQGDKDLDKYTVTQAILTARRDQPTILELGHQRVQSPITAM